MEKGLYLPEPGKPIFGAGEEVVITGYTRHLGGLSHMNYSMFNVDGDNGRFVEPWIPGQSLMFDVARSSMSGIHARPHDQLRCFDLHLREGQVRVAALSRRADERGAKEIILTYLIMSDTTGLNAAWSRISDRFDEDATVTASDIRRMSRYVEYDIVLRSQEVLHRLALQHPGFFYVKQTPSF